MFHTYVEKADDDANGRVRLKDFVHILEANDVKVAFFRMLAETQMNSKVEEEEMENFMKLVDENGEISKHDLIIQVFEILLNPAKWKNIGS